MTYLFNNDAPSLAAEPLLKGDNTVDMDKVRLVQAIGNEVCPDCGDGEDCGEKPSECYRIKEAVKLLDDWQDKMPGKA